METFSWLPTPEPIEWFTGELAIWQAKPSSTVASWAHGERFVHNSPLPGPWDNDTMPHLTEIMETISKPWVREIFIAGGSQGGKTDTAHNAWGWIAVNDPGPCLIVHQDKDSGSEVIQDRLIPMISDTPSLRRLKTKNPDDLSLRRIRLKNGMSTYLAWSNSEGRLASKPIRYLIMDEVDLYPESAIRKARARTRAFRSDRKILELCTTSTENGRIWQAQKIAHACMDFLMVCPMCGEAQISDFSQLTWPDDILDPAQIRRGMVHYCCSKCSSEWDEEDRNDAVKHGYWKARQETDRPESVWFHVPPILSRFVSFHDIIAAYLTQLMEPTPANVTNFYNDFLGLPIPEDSEGEILRENELYQRREDYSLDGESWQIPMDAVFLTAFADIQANRIECECVAWGDGHESWGVEYKVFHGDPLKDDHVWDQLHTWAQESSWRHESGATLKIFKLGVDIGFGSKSVSNFILRDRGRYLATKGSNTAGMPLIPHKPSHGKYGVNVYMLGTEEGKSTLFSWLTAIPGPRYCHFPKSYDLEWFRMLCAERPIRKKDSRGKMVQVWEKRKGYTRNESLDIRVGNIAVREMLNPNYKALSAMFADPSKRIEAPKRRIYSKGVGSGGWSNKWKEGY